MRRRSTQALLGALLLPVALTPAVVGSPASAKEPRPPAQSSPAAERALDRVLDLVDTHAHGSALGHGTPTDATMALLKLKRHYDSLDAADRRTARSIFARPDTVDGTTSQTEYAWSLDTAEQAALQHTCNDRFCVHWVPEGTPDDNGAPSHNGVAQAYVDATVAAMTTSWDTEVTRMGYARPDGDGTEDGGQDLVDVYLVDTASPESLALGYAFPETASGDGTSTDTDYGYDGYMAVDNDMAELADTGTDAMAALRTTISHEFFHLVQFGYDVDESPWLYESTATWMEHQVYPDDETNPGALKYSSMRKTWIPLDEANGATEYGNWVFHQLTTERLGTDTILHVWQSAGKRSGNNTRSAMDTAYRQAGSYFAREFRTFQGASMAPRRYWADGNSFYPSATISKNWTLGLSRKTTGNWVTSINHLAAVDFVLKPDSSLPGHWQLHLRADPEATHYNTAYVMIVYKDGRVESSPMYFDGGNTLDRDMPFSSSTVSRVAISLGNASGANGHKVHFRFDIWHL